MPGAARDRAAGTAPSRTSAGLRYVASLVDVDVDGDAIVEVTDRLYAEQLGGDGVAVVVGAGQLRRSRWAPPHGSRGLRAGDLASSAAKAMDGQGRWPRRLRSWRDQGSGQA